MKLLKKEAIPRIDAYATEVLDIPPTVLMGRAADAVADVVRAHVPSGGSVLILAGCGNNGGDGYATAAALAASHTVAVCEVFDRPPRTEEGQYYRSLSEARGVPLFAFSTDDTLRERILTADCLVDAVFGTGLRADVPAFVAELAAWIGASPAYKVAVDIPLGVCADDGTVSSCAYRADTTVVLSYYKVGMLSYPAREYLGELVLDTLGLPPIPEAQESPYESVDLAVARRLMPVRGANTHKGSFGKLLTLVGSPRYRGAAHLALGAALRSGVGLVTFLGESALVDSLLPIYPEAIYRTDGEALAELDRAHSATLIGCGCGADASLGDTVVKLLLSEGTPLVLDADAINALSLLGDVGRDALRSSRRPVVLTPHPLELARLLGICVSAVQADRLSVAMRTAEDLGVILVLKGAGTVVTDGTRVYLNTSGSSALAKGGSGDVLAGLLGGLCASGVDPLSAAALAVFVHGAAADRLAERYSTLGVTPSDLPQEMACVLGDLVRGASAP